MVAKIINNKLDDKYRRTILFKIHDICKYLIK